MSARALAAVALALAVLLACTNNPYPDSDDTVRVRYHAMGTPPKTLDPAISYYAHEHKITANLYETLLEYHYLKRPYTLMPALAREMPEPKYHADGSVSYRFHLREGMLFQDDPAFGQFGENRTTREVEAGDVAFHLMRLADPAVNSPVIGQFARIEGFREFSKRLAALREEDPEFASKRIDRQYAAAGGVSGLRVTGKHELELVLTGPYPQILYWFAMPFTVPVPWEAIAWYDGEGGRDFFKDHPISVGPFKITRYDKRSRIVLERNTNWYGLRYAAEGTPGTVYPSEGEAGDAERGLLDPAYVGRPLPFLDRIEFRIERESIPTFNKFLQGYYDAAGVIQESFDKVVHNGGLSEEMEALGMRLEKSIDPDLFYAGFNMDDPVVGTPAGKRGRKLRQAMSLAIDAQEFLRVFSNGLGIAAQSVLAPGIFGYDEDYRNPFRQPDLERARKLLGEAGYPNGIDPETAKPLRLVFATGDTSSRSRLRYEYFINSWRRLGLDVELSATNSNQYREKLKKGAYQIYFSGWVADYPDPENFFFLLWGEFAQSKSGGENKSNFDHARFNQLFLEMKNLENGPHRRRVIRELLEILEVERPWIELFHRESYALYHEWLHNVKPAGLSFPAAKYIDLDPGVRADRRARWNQPILWPAYALGALGVAIVIPGVVTFLRERQ